MYSAVDVGFTLFSLCVVISPFRRLLIRINGKLPMDPSGLIIIIVIITIVIIIITIESRACVATYGAGFNS